MFKLSNMDESYFMICDSVERFGEYFSPRGLNCIESRPAGMIFDNVRKTIYGGKSRKLNYAFMAVEILSYIAGLNDAVHGSLLCKVNPNIKQFLNQDTGRFDGAYGKAFYSHLPRIIHQLKVDIDTRQAVLTIWNDLTELKSLDVPCTVNLQFFSRKNFDDRMLSLMVNMRSNDVNWGVPYDIPAFCTIQCLVADILNIDVGMYFHNAGSLHMYMDKKPKIVPYTQEEFYDYDFTIPKLKLSDFDLNDNLNTYDKIYVIRDIIYDYLHKLFSFVSDDNFDLRNFKLDKRFEDNNYIKFWHNLIVLDKEKL